MQGILYIVGTPIGNLGDFSERAKQILAQVDFIAAEDTRVTLKLLNHFQIRKPLESYFEHNKREKGKEILGRILAGESCALVTDAGMPAISDPGADLVALCTDENVEIRVVPGPCAAVSALAVSALETGRFCFEGFLSVNKKSRREHLLSVADERRTMIFYEAPHKLAATLRDMHKAWGNRKITLARELTKIHEQVWRTTLSEAEAYYAVNQPRGEFVLVIEGRPEETCPASSSGQQPLEQAANAVYQYKEQGLSHNQAVKTASKEFGVPRSVLYKSTLPKNN